MKDPYITGGDPAITNIKRKAEKSFSKGNYNKALEQYQRLKDLLPRDMRIVQKIAEIYKKLGNVAEAKMHFKEAAEYFAKEGYWAKAVALNKVLMSIDPLDNEVQQSIADIYTSQGLSGQKLVFKTQKSPEEQKPYAEVSHKTAEEVTRPTPKAVQVESDNSESPKLWRVPLFSELKPEAMKELIETLAVRRIPAGSIICKEGETGNSMFVISDGWVEIFTGKLEEKNTLDSLKEGDFFGEFGLLTDGLRHASALAKSDVVLLEITSKHFSDLSEKHPHVKDVLDEYFKTRMFDNVLRQSHIFDSLFTADRLKAVKKFTSREYSKGQFIFKEGDDPDNLYFVKKGEIEIITDHEGDQLVVARLFVGDFFGEIAIINNLKRTASARAAGTLELLVLSAENFRNILNEHPQLLQNLKKTVEARVKDTLEAYQSHQDMKKCLGMV